MPLGRERRQRRRRVAAVGAAGAAVGKRRAEKQAAEAEPQQPEASAAPDYTAELEKLAKLRDDGVITAEDYEAKKKQLLGI
jgi:Short C-terminal domain